MSTKTNVSWGTGPGFLGALALLLIFLKLWGKIDWSWWWILAPIWMPTAFIGAMILIFLIIWGIIKLWKKA